MTPPNVESNCISSRSFKGRLIAITTSTIRSYTAQRLAAGAKNATVNRELALIKRMFSLAVKDGKLHARPHIPMLCEDNTRTGFFERDQFDAVRRNLPEPLRPVVAFAYLTGWRIKSEILPLEWRQVDWSGRVVGLDPGTTKNREGRTYPFTAELESLLIEQDGERERLQKAGQIVPRVFHRDGEPIRDFRKARDTATTAAGCPGRIPHDFRRTAVRNLERAGVPRSTAMAMVGHKTETIYRRYAIQDEGMLRDVAARLDRVAGTLSGTPARQSATPAKAHSA
jgi:integrase